MCKSTQIFERVVVSSAQGLFVAILVEGTMKEIGL